MKEKGVRENIIEILSNEWPLTAKQIFNRLGRNYAVNISYQGVHKHLKGMLDEKIITKNERDFMLSYAWIKKMSDYGKKLEKLFDKNISNDGSVMLIFNSFVECGKFAVNEFSGNVSGKFPNPENKDFVCMWNHAWPLVGISQEEHETMKRAFKEEIHWNVCTNDTYLDKLTSDYLAKLGKNVALNKKFSTKVDTLVRGDYILQVYFPEECEKEMDKIYKKVKNQKDLDMQKLFEFTCREYKIKAVIFKNKELADSLREEAKKIYEESLKEKRK
ncbi:MAG: hypothetical protein ABIJ74_04120 [archaeon]